MELTAPGGDHWEVWAETARTDQKRAAPQTSGGRLKCFLEVFVATSLSSEFCGCTGCQASPIGTSRPAYRPSDVFRCTHRSTATVNGRKECLTCRAIWPDCELRQNEAFAPYDRFAWSASEDVAQFQAMGGLS